MYNIVFLGAPGAGKGTQAVQIARILKLAHLATGDIFRKAVERKDGLGKKVKNYIEKGELVPDDITIKIMLERMTRPDAVNGVILDGFPRNLKQAVALDGALTNKDTRIAKVVYIKVREKELVKRLSQRWVCRNCQKPYCAESAVVKQRQQCPKCGGELYQRPDDKKETIERRLEVYLEETAPLIEYYEETGRIVAIDGQEDSEIVTGRIINTLDLKSTT